MESKKISIVIPGYNPEKYVRRCLESVVNQTYKNLEIIVVNDGSTDKTQEIVNEFAERDSRIKPLQHDKNKGLFQARLTGADVATGDYIAFLDSDDYVDLDYYRELLYTIEKEKTDMVFSNTVLVNNSKKYIFNYFNTCKTKLKNEEILNEYFSQTGLNYRWHTIWNKLYTMDLWKNARKHYDDIKQHLVMTEDFAFSSILFYYANSIAYNNNANIFYFVNDDSSTSVTTMSLKKIKKSLEDIKLSFDFVEEFLKSKKIYKKYETEFVDWKTLFGVIWYQNIENANLEKEEYAKAIEILKGLNVDYNKTIKNQNNFYMLTTDFNENLLNIKEQIVNSEVVSFDIFDTLVQRGLYEPTDLFYFLNFEFNKIFKDKSLLEFSKIRISSEQNCRKKIYDAKKYDEITLDEIYDYISEEYGLDRKKLQLLEKKEKELEVQFCERRNSAYGLYELAKHLGKKVIATSDMYLPLETVEKILNKCGYADLDKIYLSSELRITKWNGKLFEKVISDFEVVPRKIVHIGDNEYSDYKKPQELKMKSCHFPKSIDIMQNNYPNLNNTNLFGKLNENFSLLNIDHQFYRDYMGVRCSLGIIANKFFDNPFISFNSQSDFNSNPYLIGYYNLGMHILSLSKWLLDNYKNKKYDSLSFMARDGYIPYLACKELSSLYDIDENKLNYVHVSRKSLMPLSFTSLKDLYKINEYFNMNYVTVEDILNSLKDVITLTKDYEKILEKSGFKLDKTIPNEKYNEFIKLIYDKFYDKNKYNEYLKIAKDYFEQNFKGNAATFDIGYSGQPELILSNILGKEIDTYFIHANSDNAFKNSKYAGYNVNLFYQYKPSFTGTLREYMISNNANGCIGYKKEKNECVPIFGNSNDYHYFDKKMLEELQTGCIDFIKDFKNKYSEFFFDVDMNGYYMSIPYEYYMMYSKYEDRLMFKGLTFEHNVGENIDMVDFWYNRIDEYASICSKYNGGTCGKYTYESFFEERVAHRNKLIRFIFYLTYDRVALRDKIKKRLNPNGIVFKTMYAVYKKIKKH